MSNTELKKLTKRAALEKFLVSQGYSKRQGKGSHTIYTKVGSTSISFPNNSEITIGTLRNNLQHAGLKL